jgi:hypothetical protein
MLAIVHRAPLPNHPHATVGTSRLVPIGQSANACPGCLAISVITQWQMSEITTIVGGAVIMGR